MDANKRFRDLGGDAELDNENYAGLPETAAKSSETAKEITNELNTSLTEFLGLVRKELKGSAKGIGRCEAGGNYQQQSSLEYAKDIAYQQ
ncbi:hypothetical protein CHU98_g9563 [Xylaria longipes]|nr:hypothetical protein CHU98_g9563 [Xylaria longipes]